MEDVAVLLEEKSLYSQVPDLQEAARHSNQRFPHETLARANGTSAEFSGNQRGRG